MRKFRRYLISVFAILAIVFYTSWKKISYADVYEVIACCTQETKECLACREMQTLEKFCANHLGRYGCQGKTNSPTSVRAIVAPETFKSKSLSNSKSEPDSSNGVGDRNSPNNSASNDSSGNVKDNNSPIRTEENKNTEGMSHVIIPGNQVIRMNVMIAITVKNSRGYVKFTSAALSKYLNIISRDVHLFLESSTKIEHTELAKWYGNEVHIFPAKDSTNENTKLSRILKNFLESSYKFLLLISDDMILSRHWESFVMDNINKTDGILSIYHSSVMHSFGKDCENQNGDLCIGNSIGKYGVVFTRPVVMSLLATTNLVKSSTKLNWTKITDGTKLRLFYTPKSLSMMIRQINQNEDNCGSNEVAYKFNRCEFPDWIKDGIEFYFDRCTSSQEDYLPGQSIKAINDAGRYWTRPVIAYSLYGDHVSYLKTAVVNAVRVFSIYPGWKLWIYTDYSIPHDTQKLLCELDVRFINMTGTNLISKMSWRFLVASAPVKMYAMRDADSHLLARGKAAVDEWIASGRKFHVMRDHYYHAQHPMSGGMWGGLHDAIPNMKELLFSRRITNNYMADMTFLREVIWKDAQKSAWVHDSHSIHKWGEDHPFPAPPENPEDYVGRIVILRKKQLNKLKRS